MKRIMTLVLAAVVLPLSSASAYTPGEAGTPGGTPSSIYHSNGFADLFSLSPDNKLFNILGAGSTWSKWHGINTDVAVNSFTPVRCSNGVEVIAMIDTYYYGWAYPTLQVAKRAPSTGAQRQTQQQFGDPRYLYTWSAWQNLGYYYSNPSAVYVEYTQVVSIAALYFGSVNITHETGPCSGQYNGWTDLGHGPKPFVETWVYEGAYGNVDVYALDADGGFYYFYDNYYDAPYWMEL